MENIAAATDDAASRAIAKAAHILRSGGLVAFPTETVYGLGADAGNDHAVAAIFAVKNRPRFNPLIVHVTDLAAAERLAEFTAVARKLASKFWPGPLTLVLARRRGCPLSLLVSAGLDTVAVRVPGNALSQKLLAVAKIAVAAPSANTSGELSPTTAEHVRASLGEKVDFILDGGRTEHGLESTVIGFDGETPVLLRPGAIPRETIEAVAGRLAAPKDAKISSPGQLASHYAPKAPLLLNATDAKPGELLLGFGPAKDATRNLSANGDLREAAANLFAMLRELDAMNPAAIAVMAIPDHGLGEAINDRLRRAAAPRDNNR